MLTKEVHLALQLKQNQKAKRSKKLKKMLTKVKSFF